MSKWINGDFELSDVAMDIIATVFAIILFGGLTLLNLIGG